MNNWKKCKLGDAPLEFIDGDRGKNYPKQNEFYSNEYCLFLSTKNVRENGFDFSECQFITKEKDEILKKGKLKINDLVLTTRGTIGNLALYKENTPYKNIRINSGMLIIRPNNEELDSRYAFYLFKNLKDEFDNFVSGSAQPQLPIRDLREVEITLPPLEEQRQIAAILSSIDDKIELLHEQNKTLEELAQTLFVNWFKDKEFDSTIGDFISIQNGFAFKSKDFIDCGDNGVIKIKNISNGIVDIVNTDKISQNTINEVNNKFKINSGDILFAMTGAEIGKMGIVPNTNKKLWLNQRVGMVKERFLGARFLAYIHLTSEFGYDYIINSATGSAQENISATDIENCPFVKLTSEEIVSYSKQLNDFFEKIIFNLGEIQTLENMRDILIPKLLNGEIKINN